MALEEEKRQKWPNKRQVRSPKTCCVDNCVGCDFADITQVNLLMRHLATVERSCYITSLGTPEQATF